MRLIDADVLQKNINTYVFDASDSTMRRAEHIARSHILNLIDSQPTAYDMDKVLEELRNLLWDCYVDRGIGIDRETGFKAYERELERILKQ